MASAVFFLFNRARIGSDKLPVRAKLSLWIAVFLYIFFYLKLFSSNICSILLYFAVNICNISKYSQNKTIYCRNITWRRQEIH